MSKRSVIAAVALASTFAAVPARAVDGRTVLLRLAGLRQSIRQRLPPAELLFSDFWNQDPFPGCSMTNAPSTTSAISPLGNGSSAGITTIGAWTRRWAPIARRNTLCRS